MFRNAAIMGAALAVLASGGLILSATDSFAESTTDPFGVAYYLNAHTVGPVDTLRVVDPDAQDSGGEGIPACANIYVFDTVQELQECCACPITPAGRLDFNVNTDLTATPVTGVTLVNGVIKIVKTGINPLFPNTKGALICDPTNGHGSIPPNYNEFPAGSSSFFSWITHDEVRGVPGSTAVSEVFFESTGEPTTDLTVLQAKCTTAQITGAAHGLGVCSCPAGPIP